MSPRLRGFVLAAVHVLLISSLGGKLLYERATRPRVWVRTAPIDPNLPIRGRYVSLRLRVPYAGFPEQQAAPNSLQSKPTFYSEAILEVRGGQLFAVPAPSGTTSQDSASQIHINVPVAPNNELADMQEPVPFFIPEKIVDPSIHSRDEELWVEVTVPAKGLPRPIRLARIKNGVFTPLDVR